METVVIQELCELSSEREGPCVSVYLPTHVAGEQQQQDRVRLKNLLQAAEDTLCGDGMRAATVRRLLEPARALPRDSTFWNARSHGLAIFIAPDLFRRYRLPRSFDERVVVNRRLHLKPLLPLLTGDTFYVLALSQNRVRLFLASRYSIESVDLADLPGNMQEALNYTDTERGSQVHSGMRGGPGKQSGVFHGQGGEPDARKDDLAQYFRLVNASLAPILRDQKAPLLLAGVEYLLPIFRETCPYAHIADRVVTGNCDYLSADEIHERALAQMEPVFLQARETAADRYHQQAGSDKTCDDLRHIVPAAHDGRIECLFYDQQALQWGRYDTETSAVTLHASPDRGDEDLLDLAAMETLLHRGTVYPVEPEQVPGGKSAAALLRY